MTLDSPIVKMKMAAWQQELRELTGNEAVLLTSFIIPDQNSTWERILDACYLVTRVPKKKILGKNKEMEVVRARQLLTYFAFNYARIKQGEIADILKQERTTVIKNMRTIEGLLQSGDYTACKAAARINAILFPETNTVTNGQ